MKRGKQLLALLAGLLCLMLCSLTVFADTFGQSAGIDAVLVIDCSGSLDMASGGTDPDKMNEAVKMIEIITTDFEKGQKFTGKVISIKEFGAFVEFAPGKEGMVHISKIANERIEHVEDVLTLGDTVNVVCLGKDKMGRISFSIKDAEN